MERKTRFNETIMNEFLSRHDLVYEKPATIWDKGIPLGNSLVSAVVWGEKNLNITMNRIDVWEMRRYQPETEKFKWRYFEKLIMEGKYDNPKGVVQGSDDPGPTAQQLPIGRFEVSTKGQKKNGYSMRLSLYDAMASGRYSTEYGDIQWKCHVSAKHPLIIFNYKVIGNEEVGVKFRFCSEPNQYKEDYEDLAKTNPARARVKLVRGYEGFTPEMSQVLKDWGYPNPERFNEGEGTINCYKQEIPENGNYAVAWFELDHGNREKTIVVSITCDSKNGEAENEAISIVKEFSTNEHLAIEENEHKRWWHEFYPKSFYSINDTKLEGLYWINWYKLGCQTRKDGVAPTMSGVWAPDDGTLATLGNTYIWNTQQQVNLFGIYTGNRLNLAETTYNLLIDNRDKMADYSKRFFEVDGEFLPHITDWQLNCQNYSINNFELLCGPWMCQLMWNHYKYSMDGEFLRNTVYPMMKSQCKVLISLLEKGKDGKLHFPYTMSAEYPALTDGRRSKKYENRWGPDSTCDLGYTRFMCETLIEVSKILGIEDEDKTKWEYTLENIVPFSLDEFGGLMVRHDLAYTTSHRHLTHLFPITQLYQITYDTPEGKEIIDKSMHALIVAGTGEWMGWTFSETAKLALLSNKPSLAYSMIHEYSDKYVNENTFDCDGSNNNSAFTFHYGMGLTVESDGMFNDALQYFAVRSFNDDIYVMDVLPDSWLDMSVWNFRTEGAFLVSAQRREGITDFISIYSEKGGTVRLKSCYGTEVDITCEGKKYEYEIVDGKVEFETEKDNEYIITQMGSKPKNMMILPVKAAEHELNHFGVKMGSRY